MDKNAVIPTENGQKANNVETAQKLAQNNQSTSENKKERKKLKFGAEMNEKIVCVPQIYILLVFAFLLAVWTIVIYCVSGFWWQSIVFLILPFPLVAAIFLPDFLNIKWHFLAQTCCWGSWAFLLLVYVFVCIYWYVQGTGVFKDWKIDKGEEKAKQLFSEQYTPYLWFVAYVAMSYACICPVMFFLLRMTVHGFMGDGMKAEKTGSSETTTAAPPATQ